MARKKQILALLMTSLALVSLTGCIHQQAKPTKTELTKQKTELKEKQHEDNVKNVVNKVIKDNITSGHTSQTIKVNNITSNLNGDFSAVTGLLNMKLSVNKPQPATNEYWYQTITRGKSNKYTMYARTKGMTNWQKRNIKAQQDQLSAQSRNINTQKAIWAQMANRNPELINIKQTNDGYELTIKNSAKSRKAIQSVLNLNNQGSNHTVTKAQLNVNADKMGVPAFMHMTLNSKQGNKVIHSDQTFMQINQRNHLKLPKSVTKNAKLIK